MYTGFFRVLVVSILLAANISMHSQTINLGMDFQTNSVMQLTQASDGTLWGITSSNIDRLPTIAGVWSVRSTNGGATWDTACITDNWWRWGVDIAAQDAGSAYAVTMREDTLELYHTKNGKQWSWVAPRTMSLDNVLGVHFFNARVGFVLGTHGRKIERKFIVSTTTDGGATWLPSLALLPDPPTEVYADYNDRAVCWKGATVCIGMNSGRILYSADSAVTWKFLRTPLQTISALMIREGEHGQTIIAMQTKPDGSVRAVQSANGFTWTNAPLPKTITNVHGARELPDGSWVSVPRSLMHSGCIDFDTGKSLNLPPGCDGLAVGTNYLFTGQELLPGKGLIKVLIPESYLQHNKR